MKSIAVFCGSKQGLDPIFADHCKTLAQAFVDQGITMVYGGGKVGLMGKMADTILSKGGEVIGVIPEKIKQMGVSHNRLSKLHIVAGMHERKAMMSELSQGFISLPGGIGTMEEMFEIFSWRMLGYHSKPHGILNTEKYYDPLIELLDGMVRKGFLELEHRNSLVISDKPRDLLRKLIDFNEQTVKKHK